MSKGNTDLITKEHAEGIERIKAYHAGFEKSFGDQMGYAFLAGAELNHIKETLPHGKFMDWREAHLPEIPHRTATQYMTFQVKLATHCQFPPVGKANILGNANLNDKDREKVLAAVHEIADGKTLTQLYRDLGVIREKKAPQHHPRKEKSPEDKIADRKQAARDLMNTCCAPLATFLLDPGDILVELTKAERREWLDLLVQASNEIRQFKA